MARKLAPGPCLACGRPIEVVPGLEARRGVTSDCRPWPRAGRLAACHSCGLLQKITDARWNRDVERIYAGYSIYHQAAGAEQAVFYASGLSAARSDRLVARLDAAGALPAKGRLLDVGCGNGALLAAFGRRRARWRLAGTELSARHRAHIESLPGVEKLYVGRPEKVPGRFDAVSLIHVIEHLPAPQPQLRALGAKLRDRGLLLIETPNAADNPFDLVITDHCSHFSRSSLRRLLARSGFGTKLASDRWVPKELSVVAQLRASIDGAKGAPDPRPAALRSLRWLEKVVADAKKRAADGPLGLFGTSIAATWLFGELGRKPAYFVDEDPNRIGRTVHGRPVRSPDSLPAGSRVYMPLPPKIAVSVAKRLKKRGLIWFTPPAL